jgi:hypothetical protein
MEAAGVDPRTLRSNQGAHGTTASRRPTIMSRREFDVELVSMAVCDNLDS